MNISIVIPTYNRLDNLLACLRKLTTQSLQKDKYEIIIIDDGTDFRIEDIVLNFLKNCQVSYLYQRQKNQGPAAARNLGIKNSKNEIILFIGDDILAGDDFLLEHYNFHQNNPANNFAMLGFTTWHKEIIISEFMVWLEESGFQFNYNALKPGQEVNYKFFYTCNLSIKKDFLLNFGLFNTKFIHAAFEDTELGFRLERKNMKLIYNPKAISYHDHVVVVGEYLKRMEKTGESARIFVNEHPEIKDSLIRPARKIKKYGSLIKLALILFSFALRIKTIKRFYWKILLLQAFARGYYASARKKNI